MEERGLMPAASAAYLNKVVEPTASTSVSVSAMGVTALMSMQRKCPDTVGELKSATICVSHMPSWKAKKPRKLLREKVLLEL